MCNFGHRKQYYHIEVNKMIYKGIFWLIEGELYTKKLECDKSGNVIGDGSGLNSKSGDNFNHRLT